MTDLRLFNNGEFEIQVTPIGDSFTVGAPGLARALAIRDATRLVETIPDKEKGYTTASTPGGDQRVWYVTEAGFYRALGQRQAARVKDAEIRAKVERFQDWVYGEVLPAVRKTGSYGVQPIAPSLSSPDEVLALAERYVESAKALVAANSRLAIVEPKAEAFAAIEGGDGVALRVFHKKYFSDVKETAFFEHLYRKGYLIDQRGKGGWSERRMKYRDGAQHRHPSYKGKPFLYLHASVDDRDNRHETPRVRPGTPELTFRDALVREGLPPNASQAIERKAS